MQLTPEHEELAPHRQKFIADEINPHVDAWEEAERFPAHRGVQEARRARPARPQQAHRVRRRGPRLLLYAMVMAEALGNSHCGGVPMAIGVQTDMCTPALARFGSDELRARVSGAGDRGRFGRLPRRLGSRQRLRCRGDPDHRPQGRRRLRHRRRQDVDHQRHAGRLAVPARQHVRGPRPQEQVADRRADEHARA